MGKVFGFDWSFSRAKVFRDCPRAYFYEYASRDEPEYSEASKLKRLATPEILSGIVVDSVLGRSLLSYRLSGEVPFRLADQGEAIFERWWKHSYDFAARLRNGVNVPKNALVLAQHYFECDKGPETKLKMRRRIRNCLNNFEFSELSTHLQDSADATWGEIRIHGDGKLPPSFYVSPKIKLWIAIDFFMSCQSQITILDWKTGRKSDSSEITADRQLRTYALYANQVLGFQPEKIRIQAIWLQNDFKWQPSLIRKNEMESIRTELIKEASFVLSKFSYKGFLGVRSIPVYTCSREDFPPKPAARKCQNCKFLTICPEGSQSHISFQK
jgi:hypothetical protein